MATMLSSATTQQNVRPLPISQIKIGTRHRKDLGDLEALAASLESGLLQPIGVTPRYELIWGYRRLVAQRDILGRDEILCRIVPVSSITQGEFDENVLRKDFSPSERVAIVESLRGFAHGGDRKSHQGRSCDVDRVTTRQAAERVGFCRDDYFRARKVVSQGIPELVEAMDAGRLSVSAAAEIAGASPEAQKEVLGRVKDERGWAVRGVRKSLNKTLRKLEIEEAKGRHPSPPGDGDIRLYHCAFQLLEEVAGIKPASVNLILTDIPYGQEFLPEVAELGAFASRVLVAGGLLVTYCGQFFLNRVIRSLDEHLTWAWSAASAWMGNGTPIHPRQVTSKWKPILIFSKGQWRKRGRWQDLSVVTSKEKDWHEWQQPLEEVEALVRYFSDPGDLVVDPCGGAFTTAVACKNHARRCIACDIDEVPVIRGQDRLAGKSRRV
jgi:hypothetical protein